MRWPVVDKLFWTTIGVVMAAFLLALIGEETPSLQVRNYVLYWHEWLGLLSWIMIIVVLMMRFAEPTHRPPLPNWLPGLRRTLTVLFYILLVLQPLSGWLLASHEGKLASFLGWILPPLAHPDSRLAHLGYVYHGIGSALIILIALFSVRLGLTARVFNGVVRIRRRRRTAARSEERRLATGEGADLPTAPTQLT
jgi:cytochrome b561